MSELGIYGLIINQEGRDQFDDYRTILIQRECCIPKTNDSQKPIVIKLFNKHHNKITYITLLDSPGEDFNNIWTLLDKHRNLQYADGIIFLINPLNIAGLLALIKEEKPGSLPPDLQPTRHNVEIIELLYELFMKTEAH